ncbi:DUF2630 family protein [Actinomycetes bacterium M1A6_2h]
MSEKDIHARIKDLIDQEHELRSKTEAGDLDPAEGKAQLTALEESLDQAWDLLRRRRARIDGGLSPDDAETASVKQVEGYLQ